MLFATSPKYREDRVPTGLVMMVTWSEASQQARTQYDHVPPHARGGNNDPGNVIVTCAPCNFGRMDYTLEEVGLADPRLREQVRAT